MMEHMNLFSTKYTSLDLWLSPRLKQASSGGQDSEHAEQYSVLLG